MKLNNLFIFILGFGLGSVISMQLVKEKYKKDADKEIASVVEHFKEKINTNSKQIENPDFEEMNNIITLNEYSNKGMHRSQQNYDNSLVPYLISLEEFCDNEEQTYVSLTYYADNILVDKDGNIIDNPEQIIGDALNHFTDIEQNFEEYEKDTIYVRNNNTKCDYEIIKVDDTFYWSENETEESEESENEEEEDQ